MKKIYIRLFIFFYIIMVCFTIDARVRTIQTDREFNKEMKRSQIAVVLLYSNDRKITQKHGGNKVKLLKMYELVSDRRLYEDANITFIKVAISSQAGQTLIQSYEINDYPVWLLFKDNHSITADDGKPASLMGFVLANQLEAFIDNYLRMNINDIIFEKKQKEQEMIKQSQNEANPYLYPAVMYVPTGDTSSWKKPTK